MLSRVYGFQHAHQNVEDIVEILLQFQCVVNAIVAAIIQLTVVHGGIVLEMCAAGGFDKAVRHQGAGGHHGVEHAVLDHVGKHQTHFGDGHGAREGAHHEAVRIGDHVVQHVGGLAEAAPTEGGPAHGLHEVREALDVRQVERDGRVQLVRKAVPQIGAGTGRLIGLHGGLLHA